MLSDSTSNQQNPVKKNSIWLKFGMEMAKIIRHVFFLFGDKVGLIRNIIVKHDFQKILAPERLNLFY